ncbi:MAG: ISKra4 family transposase [Candidatus Heimdallarchaeota archaeon]
MSNINDSCQRNQGKNPCDAEVLLSDCREKFNQILSDVLQAKGQEAHQVEASIFKSLMELGLLLLQLFLTKHNCGDYGLSIQTAKGLARRSRSSEKSYFSIFGKLKVKRYLYEINGESFAPLDIILNLPRYCYSYFLSEWVNQLNVNNAYGDTVAFLKKFLGLKLSVSAVETISKDSATEYEAYYEFKQTLPESEPVGELTVLSFDGKGVPMIKKEATKIKARQGKGEKRQKKKEALVGAKYTINVNPRTPEEVARNLVFPERKDEPFAEEAKREEKAQDIRYIASVEKPKREVMREIYEEVKDENFDEHPLLCLIDGAKSLLSAVWDVFRPIENKVIILDIIHVLEYIWLIAHLKYGEGSDEASEYVYEKLFLILEGNVSAYIHQIQNEPEAGSSKASQKNTFSKVITYFQNHQPYMKYDDYLAKGYPIATGVVESACSHVVKDRMEISGARWGLEGAEAILRLRSIAKSQDWDEYWDFYTAQFRDKDFLHQEGNSLNLQEKMAA